MSTATTVVITGSTRGLGYATARHCLQRGANVVISSEDNNELQHALSKLAAESTYVAGQVCDVSRREDVAALLAFALERFGAVDVWINNAGTSTPSGAVIDVPIALGERVISTNIFGVYYGSVLVARYFRQQGKGRLINIVGRGEKKPVATANMYASSKAWIRNFTIAMHKELMDSGIEFCAFNPGFIVTRLSTRLRVMPGYEHLARSLGKIIPLLGASADSAAAELVALALGPAKLPVTRSRERLSVIVPLLFRRLVLREPPPCSPADIEMQVIAKE